ncbi:MAG: hypothetical protein CM1200mP13_13990 [Candidatus Pelagibacterales bacterium]|nr:MAG: hypothetical protein CM1200mP13_13990 [Pelagibacterales bacterium]
MEMQLMRARLLEDTDNQEMEEKVDFGGLEEYLEVKTVTGWKD